MSGPSAVRRYQLVEKLASGGMGEIFLARVDGVAGFTRPCVIKRIHRHLVAMPGFVSMFLDEARLAARLNHPGIAQILDLGREGDDFFIALEYLAGRDVAAVLARCGRTKTPVPIDVALKVASAAAEALHYAHELTDELGTPMNIVHRDVSPSNLFLTFQGAVKVLDFGIARANHRFQETAVGQIKGKAAYMSPEQTRGLVDRRADVWSLGVVLHEMLTGERLFVGQDWIRTTEAVREARIPRPSETRRDVPEDVDAVVMAALERNLDKRVPTADALRVRLDGALRDHAYVSPMAQLAAFVKGLFEGEAELPRVAEASGSGTRDIITLSTSEMAGTQVTGQLTPPATPFPVPERVTLDTTGQGARAPERSQVVAPAVSWRRPLGIGVVTAVVVAAVLVAVGRPAKKGPVVPGEPQVGRAAVAAPPMPPPPAVREPAPAVAAVEREPAATNEEAPSATEPAREELAAIHNREAPARSAVGASPEPRRTPARPSVASLSVETNKPVSVSLDGSPVGDSPLKRMKVSPGEHRLKFENAQGFSRTVRIVAKAGEELTRRETFRESTLNVSVDPWADVFLDGSKLGQTPLVREVWDGHHELKLVGPRGAKKVLGIDVIGGKPLVIDETL